MTVSAPLSTHAIASARDAGPGGRIAEVIAAAEQIVLGKPRQIRLAVACLLAGGHLLIEDLPGVGKTTLAHALARLLGLNFQRIQFTSDLLPADVIGVSIFDRELAAFRFVPGPIFSQLLLADEINRATPKAQSALLEAMEEYQVTADGETRALPSPFFVIATQNPSHQIGTFPLPESQLDRFLMRLEIGYPDVDAERALLAGGDRRQQLSSTAALLEPEALPALQQVVKEVRLSPALIGYVHALILASRQSPVFQHGLSPRAGLALAAAGRAWAFLDGRMHVLPEDIQTVLPEVIGHRLRLSSTGAVSAKSDIEAFMHTVALP
jgi:MoxR-like ATPase